MNIALPLDTPHCDRPDPERPPTLLLIDDEAYFRRFVSVVANKSWRGSIVEACDGREAIGLFSQIQPRLVILDISMPGVDGVATLAALRQISASVPIIMLTSMSEERIVEACIGHGASFFIRKDLPADQLAAALTEALREFGENA